ncbi:DNA-binding transcriptional activator of the SARP family [Acetitomaculum ruminis DSM 5522]|uniref:DNA-binding transcriptional activator of the SARP family n=1 Tax=Acetitomaculum ruminis DSM 5522 TaxID=1120918 RepID=A0A1I0XQ85_9FIRM|nr:BTAD domain-containing putative transcriptional regulator [Acetitomaculum ruminis]SFB02847.1 DNA-binding transcriptional activator of the SARP family [Acetitomaculum ruminis DSM 5522]
MERLTVNLLGKFCVTSSDGILNDDTIRSDKLTKLFVYIILHRDHTLSVHELAQALWHEEETENPAGALKNLMYRLRNALKGAFGENKYILTSRGFYRWNTDIDVLVDSELFEKYCKDAQDEKNLEKKINFYENGLGIYKGVFMPKIQDLFWAVNLSTYYHSLYVSSVKDIANLYIESGRYADLERIAIEALSHDNVDEELHCYYIESLINQNKLKLALDSYEEAKQTLYKELGVRDSQKLGEVYAKIMSMNKTTRAEGIDDLHDDILEEETSGVFECGYQVFKQIYRLEARKIKRLGIAEFLLLFTVNLIGFEDEDVSTNQLARYKMNQSMQRLEEVLNSSLRMGDVIARYSDSQFVVMLSMCPFECCAIVENRIRDKFFEKQSEAKKVKLKTEVEEISPASSIVK